MGCGRLVLLCGLLAVLLTWASSSSLACTPAGLPSVADLMGTSQSDAYSATPDRQWLFPSLQFTCTANVTGWVFTVAVDDDSASVTCPTLELWREHELTPSPITDYVQSEFFTPDNYTEPERLSGSLYRCNLLTPLLVSSGTILGFRTISESNGATFASRVQLIGNPDAPAGYWQSVQIAAALIDTNRIENIAGVVPLIAPVLAAEPETGGTQTPLPSSLTPTLSSSTTPQSTPIPITPAFSNNPTSGTSSSSLIPVLVPVVTIAAILLVAAAVLVVVIIMLARRKSRLMQQSSKDRAAENGQLKKEKEKARVRSRNNYSHPPNHIYEDVDNMSIEQKKQQQQLLQHDYDYINSVCVSTTDDPKNYEVPSPSKGSKQALYEEPGGMSDSMAGQGGGTVGDGTYETPIDAQGSPVGGQRGEESVYETPIDAQGSPVGRQRGEESVYETPIDAGVRRGKGEMESSGVYEVVWSGGEGVRGREGDTARPNPLQTQPIDMPRRVEIRDVEHSENSLVFLQSISHLVASL